MNGMSRNHEVSPQLLDLISKDREWHENRENKFSEERKLELRLGPPGEEEEEKESLLSLGYFSNSIININNNGKNQTQKTWVSSEKIMKTMMTHNNIINKGASVSVSSSQSSFLQPKPSPPANTAVPNTSQKRYHDFFSYLFVSI